MQTAVILPVISLILGTALGLISSMIASKFKQRESVTDRLLEHYFEARTEIADIVSRLADLPIKNKLTDDERDQHRETVVTLYFKNLDFLPVQVLEALLTLHACLSNGKGRLYQVKKNSVVTIPEADYSKFVEQFARFRNTKLYSSLAFKSKNNELKKNLAIKLHAQYVLYNLNKFASAEKLLNMTKNLRKVTGV